MSGYGLAHTGTGLVAVDAHDGHDGLFNDVRGFRAVVIHAPYKGVNPPAPVAMQGDAVSGYGF